MTPRILVIALLVAVAVATGWLARPRTDETASNTTPPPIRSGYYVLDAVIYSGDTGIVGSYEIRAREAQQSAAGAPILLQNIEVSYTGDDAIAWYIEARTAALTEDSGFLEMAGNVVARREQANDDTELSLTTERLAFDPALETVSTRSRVRFLIGTGVLEATGLSAHLRNDTVELNSNVRGEYAP